MIKKKVQIENDVFELTWENIGEILKKETMLKNDEYVKDIAKKLLTYWKCPVCWWKFALSYSDNFGYFFHHTNKEEENKCSWFIDWKWEKGKKTASAQLFDNLIVKKHLEKKWVSFNENWKELVFRRDWGVFPYNKSDLEKVKNKYSISVEDMFDIYFNSKHTHYLWVLWYWIWKNKDTYKKYIKTSDVDDI